jgi:CheY-like chemotaxis protein
MADNTGEILSEKRILIIEDDAHNLAIMSAVLRRVGAKVFFERYGEEIQRRIDALNPLDAILLDLKLPSTDGFTVYENMRDLPAMNDVPVVVVSASDDTAVVNKIRDMGMDGFIAKPINSRTFGGYVANAIAGEPVWVRR